MSDVGGEDELRAHVRGVVWEPVEPFFMWLATQIHRWLG